MRIKFDVEAAAEFAAGRIDGYFGGKNCVPQEFWKMLAFYLFSTESASPAWGIQFEDGTAEKMVRMAEGIYDWYDWKDGRIMEPVPKWYRERG